MISPLRILFFTAIVALACQTQVLAADWQEYKDCKLADEKYFDGDSFKVETTSATGKSYTYVFRLYGADCPETDTRVPERLEAQSKDFGIPVDQLIKWGEKAKDFTKAFLHKPFTVHTKKEIAKGASKQNRYYAIVIGHDGRDLAEALVEAGLARAYGWHTAWPPTGTVDQYRRTLARAEGAAKSANAGIWGRELPGTATQGSIFTKPLPIESQLKN